MAVENLAISNGIEDGEISLFMSSKGELNHRPDHRSNNWVSNSCLVDHPGSDPGVGISAAHTVLLAMREAIGTATTILGLRRSRHGQNRCSA